MTKLTERRVNPDLLKLNRSQKRVLMKTIEAGDPKRAAEDIAMSPDNRNLMAAVKVLARYGLVVTYPAELGPDDEPKEVALTNLGEQHAADYNVTEDPSLRTEDEREESSPQGQPAETDTGGQEMMDMGAQVGNEELGLELSSFFREIHNWSRILKG